jgi:hypothetical protein
MNPISSPVYVELDGNQYKLSPLKLKDLQEIVNFLQFQYMENAKKTLKDLPSEISIPLLKDEIKNSKKIQLGSVEFNQEIGSIMGITKCFELSIKSNHPDMDFSKCLNLMTIENVSQLGESLAKITGLKSEEEVETSSDFTPKNL